MVVTGRRRITGGGRPPPLRFQDADAFRASCLDMGDPLPAALSAEIWWAARFPRTRPASAAAHAMLAEWREAQQP